MKWISEQLVELAKACHVLVCEKGGEKEMVEQNRIMRPELNVFHFTEQIPNCSAKENSECGLANILRKERAYCREFVIEKTKAGLGATNRSVEIIIDDKFECPHPYSCPRCFYNQCTLAFLDRLSYTSVEIELPMGHSLTSRFYLVGLVQKRPGSEHNKKVVLALKCTISSEERVFLVALRGTSVCYIEAVLRKDASAANYGYDIVQASLRTGLTYDSKVSVLPVDQIHFVSDEGIVENFYSIGRSNIDSTFGTYYQQLTSTVHYRDVIRKKRAPAPPKTGDTTSIPKQDSAGLVTMLTTFMGHATFKAAVAVSFIWITVLLLRESQGQRASLRKKVSIL